MSHNGSVGSHVFPEDVRDIRGTTVRGADDTTLGEVADVIVDHETMEIRYLLIDGHDWLRDKNFLLAADRISADQSDHDNLVAGVTRQQIANAPQFDNKSPKLGDEWKRYQQEFKKYWDEEPVMHMKDSYRIITPAHESMPVQETSSSQINDSGDRELNAADLFPDRISPVFSDPEPRSGKVTLRPKSAARAETAASGVAMLKPYWWEAFENYLRVNKDDVKAQCSQCSSKAA